MPTSRDEIFFVDDPVHRIFALAVKKRTTSWTLRELMAAAGVPDDCVMDCDLIYDYGYGEGNRAAGIDDIVIQRSEFFGPSKKGEVPYSQVITKRTRKVTTDQEYQEVSYMPTEQLDALIQAEDQGGETKPSAEQIDSPNQTANRLEPERTDSVHAVVGEANTYCYKRHAGNE